ncbi:MULTISPECIES: branched-chain amino acid ABC transporter permease [Marinobacter]|uniref:Amino acid/amide ABC transporter membrane protein 2, HAAT family n=1 Tax=Marinobacter segnicrescens TaxID=430453 RepID=A0A1I0HSV5_9GAMM|nr:MULTISPECIES: branched-chain amino acid ABC transporter permease [Marinobacter]MCK7542761.1 branched-chain amino acid ABC transporter permease [Marinobacter bryozoorum]UZD65282.1 branched-chain amino acid ABC transporter permease [Marinobacter sp. AN1]SET87092.1 amino acid/amide ABC transporter membrane protein 2, HAAT family [Marinobacter segnicrescens]
MRFLFKTSYNQDIRLFKDRITMGWYLALGVVLLVLPLLLGEYYLSQASFVLIYAIVGLGLMLLSGFTGQISLGHAAFLAVGAYTEAVLSARGVPFVVSLPMAMAVSAAAGFVVGLPALRLKGIYLAIATLAFGFIVEVTLQQWESVTGGSMGLLLEPVTLLGVTLDSESGFYYLALGLTGLTLLILKNLLRSPTGRAFVAIRDSEISARSMGIGLARYKTLAFVISAAITGLAGALYAHKLQFISPEQFGVFVSIELLMIIVIGGMGSLHGAFLGALFMTMLPEFIAILREYLPSSLAYQPGLQPTIFGAILILFVLLEPAGLYGRWVKIRTWFQLFPLYRKGLMKREKSYVKSDRLS